jgi:hypothetical protein
MTLIDDVVQRQLCGEEEQRQPQDAKGQNHSQPHDHAHVLLAQMADPTKLKEQQKLHHPWMVWWW